MHTWKGTAYAINLKHREDRLKELRAELQRHYIKYCVIEVPENHVLTDAMFKGVDPDDVRILRFSKHTQGGSVGCPTSHKAIWAYEAARQDENQHPVFIMEDDVVFTSDFTPKLLDEIQHRMETEADIVTCGILLWVVKPAAFVPPGKPPILIHTRFVRGGHAYALKRRSSTVLQRLCDLYDQPGVLGPLGPDVALEIVANLPEYTALVTLPYVAWQRGSPSDNTWIASFPQLNKLAEIPLLFNAQVSLLPIINHAGRNYRAQWYKAAGGKPPEDDRTFMWWWLAEKPIIIFTACSLILVIVIYAMHRSRKR